MISTTAIIFPHLRHQYYPKKTVLEAKQKLQTSITKLIIVLKSENQQDRFVKMNLESQHNTVNHCKRKYSETGIEKAEEIECKIQAVHPNIAMLNSKPQAEDLNSHIRRLMNLPQSKCQFVVKSKQPSSI